MNTNPFYHEAIRNLYKDVSRTNDTHGALDSKGNKIVLDDAKLAVEMDRLKKEFDAKQYQRDRKYPELGEQFDLLFKDIDSGKVSKDGGFYKAIKAVKDKHPKPSE